MSKKNPAQPPPPPSSCGKRRHGSRLNSVLVALALLAVAIAPILGIRWFLNRIDIPESEIGAIELEPYDLPDEENAYTYFCEATNSMYIPADYDLGAISQAEDKPLPDETSRIIASNSTVFALIEAGVRCKGCAFPAIDDIDDVCPFMSYGLKFGKLLKLKARHERQSDDLGSAARSTKLLIQYGEIVQRKPNSLMQYLVGLALLNLGFQEGQTLALCDRVRIEDLDILSEALERPFSLAEGLKRGVQVEYLFAANTIDRLTAENFDDITGSDAPWMFRRVQTANYYFQPNRSKQFIAEQYRSLIGNADLPYSEIEIDDLDQFFDNDSNRLLRMLRPNSIGRLLCTIVMPAMENTIEHKCRTEGELAAARLTVALQRYERSNGVFPEELVELTPDYLDSVPVDPFDGQPFRYLPDKKAIYSVGEDLADSGGESSRAQGSRYSADPPWNNKDAVFSFD